MKDLEIDYIYIESFDTDIQNISISSYIEGTKVRLNFVINEEVVGYIDFAIYFNTCELIYIFIHESFRGNSLSYVMIDIFLQFLLSKSIAYMWTEGYTTLGKQRRLGRTDEQSAKYGIEFISGIQKA